MTANDREYHRVHPGVKVDLDAIATSAEEQMRTDVAVSNFLNQRSQDDFRELPPSGRMVSCFATVDPLLVQYPRQPRTGGLGHDHLSGTYRLVRGCGSHDEVPYQLGG